MKETTHLRKSFLGGYRRDDVQEYFDELYEDAEKKYQELADEHDRVEQENLLLRQWLGQTNNEVEGLSLPALDSEAAFDLPEGVYQFDQQSKKLLDLTQSSEPVEFHVAASDHAFEVQDRKPSSDQATVKLAVVPGKHSDAKAKAKEIFKANKEFKAKNDDVLAEEAEINSETTGSHKALVEAKPKLDYPQKAPIEKARQPKHYYIQGRSKATSEIERTTSQTESSTIQTPQMKQAEAGYASGQTQNSSQTQNSVNPSASTGQMPGFDNQAFANGHQQMQQQHQQHQQQNQMPNYHQTPYYQAPGYQQPGLQSQAPQYQSAYYPNQPFYQQPAPVDPNLLARLEKLESELTQTKTKLDFANGLLKDLYK